MSLKLPVLKRRDFRLLFPSGEVSGFLDEEGAWTYFLANRTTVLVQQGRVVAEWPTGQR